MPEGDTVWRTARHLDEVLAGETLTRFDLRVPGFATSDLTGQTVSGVVSRGKHILHRIGDHTLHTHLKMEGSWHIYRLGVRWKRPAHQARAVLANADWVTVGFDLGVLELVPRSAEDDLVGYLGPDPLGPDWDAAEAARRLSADPSVPTAVALLDQRNLAGLGNEYANELCFLRGVRPTTPIGETDAVRLVDLSHRLITANRDRVRRTTTGDTRPGRESWVYGRDGRPCRRCGTRIERAELGRRATEQRVIFWCPACQR
ncbi:endonuclease VIII Nei2 [Okibacterium endophyticum]